MLCGEVHRSLKSFILTGVSCFSSVLLDKYRCIQEIRLEHIPNSVILDTNLQFGPCFEFGCKIKN